MEESPENLELMRLMDAQYMETPFFGVPRMTWWLRERGCDVNHKRVERLMRVMGIRSVLPGRHTSKPHPKHKIYPYLLHGMEIATPNTVWCADITYIPMARGFMYLVAVLDWFSRYVITWELSNSMDSSFCAEALNSALSGAKPVIFNTDQGSQFTGSEFTGILIANGIQISMDGKGRALDNVYIERFWRSLKYEDIYIKEYHNVRKLHEGLEKYINYYNHERLHSSLENLTPARVHGKIGF